jgi:type IV secretion system protein TrbL
MAFGTLDPALASDGLLSLIRGSANSWSNVLRSYATEIFGYFALMSFIWKFGMMALRRTDFDEMAAELVRWIVVIGFYAALLLYSVDWTQAIIDSFRQAGAAAAGTPAQLQPGDLFALAVELGRTVASVSLTDPVTYLVVGLSAILIVLCFTFIAAFLMVTLIEAYFVINVGVFFMGFGGSEWTREYAMAMLRYAVSVGAKLMVLQLIVGMIMTSARTWQAAYTHDETSMLTMVGLSLICAYFSKTLADTVQALISGVSVGGGSTLGGMAAAGAAGAVAGAAFIASKMGASNLASGAMGSIGDTVRSVSSNFFGGGSGSSGTPPSMGGGSSSSNFSGHSPRTGGGGMRNSAPSSPPIQPQAPSQGGSSTPSSGEAASASNQGSAPSTPKTSGVASMAHAAAEMGIKTLGTGMAVAVPGADSAASLSVGPPPSPPELSDIPGSPTPENVIRPESSAMNAGQAEAPEAPSTPPSQPLDTMSSVQEALNNRGKPS